MQGGEYTTKQMGGIKNSTAVICILRAWLLSTNEV